MKYTFLILAALVASPQSNAQTCLERLSDPNWPQDEHEYILKCERDQILHGEEDSAFGIDLCFGISHSDNPTYNYTSYSTLRFKDMGVLLDIVKSDKSGRTNRDEKLAFGDSKLTVAKAEFGAYSGSRYENETVVDTENLTIEFNHYKKRFFGKKLISSTLYYCEQEL